ncbi:multicopper oxidase [Hypoxylon trugodes]|uniref:multicopper oxidase n=1 Tax=Hypoxylon trugodes TaxID=326681 RepID=UPI00219FD7F0|nr:multicopper oxidase [Hypoxylon trugodes]KAI1388946.1 multicopper oxidase [Hypoxylon trugodes]
MSSIFGRVVLLIAWIATLFDITNAKVVRYDFAISWIRANPDGSHSRPTIGINGKFPPPPIFADVGDNVIVVARNELGNQSTSLHFHGLYMNGTTHMDGPSQVSQCSIPPGSKMTYNFTINQSGTYWYHSHTDGQYPDGLRGAFIIHDPKFPFQNYSGYDNDEYILTISDWYHDQMADLLPTFINKGNPTGAEPVPNSVLWNDTYSLNVIVRRDTTYLFRVMNIGAFAGQYIWFEGHNMTIIEVDGVYTQPTEVEMIYLSAAQRCSFFIKTKDNDDANFPFVASMDTSLFDTMPDDLNWNATAWLTYNLQKPFNDAAFLDELNNFDDITLVPYDNQTLLKEPTKNIELNVIMDNLGDGANYAFFDNITYKAPKVPSLYTALSAGDLATNPTVYGSYTHSFVLEKDEVVQIVVNNLDTGRHPFHLHGHNFQALYRSEDLAGTFEDANLTEADYPEIPMRRDTFVLFDTGFIVLRFRADNPGIWLFHCHIEWHVSSGLIATMVEAPLELQKTITIPEDHLKVCANAHIATSGNAAANMNFLDLTGEPKSPDRLPDGFTTRGKVALAFSALSGILGVLVVIWYGLAPDDAATAWAENHAEIQTTDSAVRSSEATGTEPEVVTVTAVSGGGGVAKA